MWSVLMSICSQLPVKYVGLFPSILSSLSAANNLQLTIYVAVLEELYSISFSPVQDSPNKSYNYIVLKVQIHKHLAQVWHATIH